MIHISILEGYIPGLSAAFPLKNVSAINTPIKSILDCGVPLKKFGEQNSSQDISRARLRRCIQPIIADVCRIFEPSPLFSFLCLLSSQNLIVHFFLCFFLSMLASHNQYLCPTVFCTTLSYKPFSSHYRFSALNIKYIYICFSCNIVCVLFCLSLIACFAED